MPFKPLFHPALHVLGALLLAALPLRAGLSLVRLDPAPGTANVCSDTPLRLTFNGGVALGDSGQLRVVRASDGKVVDTLDLADENPMNLFGTKRLRYEPFRVDGHSVSVQLHSQALVAAAAETYSIIVDPGVFESADGESFPGIGAGNWKFTTRAPLPKGCTRLEVAPDSRGDFCTLQGAVDYVPEDNFTLFEIRIRNGVYDSMAYLGPGRNRIRVVGEDRKKTVLAGRNNDRLNPGRMGRPFVSVDADDVTIENLTIRNTTPYKGSQAEALRLEGQRCIIRNCDFYSYQDTLLINGRVFVADCRVEGDVDFIWGHGSTFFENCELRALHDGYLVTSRNPADKFGFVFSNCTLTAAPGVKQNWLARIETGRFPDSAVAFINCRMGPHIPAIGWLVTGGDSSRLRFWEFNSTSLDGKPLDTGKRHAASRQLTAAEAAEWSDPNRVLAESDTWQPKP